MDERRPSIAIQIDRLVLDGWELGPGQERRLRAALADELERLLATGGLHEALLAGGKSRCASPRAFGNGGGRGRVPLREDTPEAGPEGY